jgi:hypothetical protein
MDVKKGNKKVLAHLKRSEEKTSPKEDPRRAWNEVSAAFEEIKRLNPTLHEIVIYAMARSNEAGVVTFSQSLGEYWGPRFHDTYGTKKGGQVHIDIGCCNYHLRLDRYWCQDFIEFIKEKRGQKA